MHKQHALSDNSLQDVHRRLGKAAKIFRQRVCTECGWSETTFYRKVKGENQCSNAEKEKIAAVLTEVLKNIMSNH